MREKEILVINPRHKARKKTTKKARRRKTKKATLSVKALKKGVKKMARRRRTRKARSYKSAAPAPAPARRRRRKHNPSRSRIAARRAGSYARSTIGGMNIKGALMNVPASVIGMMAAKWSAKRFGENAATETDPESWTWAEYLKGAAGGFVAGFLAQAVRKGTGQKVLEGAINLMVYKLVENELVPRSEWATAQFGQEETAAVQYDEQGTPYLLGRDGSAYPVDERHRLPSIPMGDELQKPGYLGDELQKPGYLGGDAWQDAYFGETGSGVKANDPFAQAFFGHA